MIRKIICMCLAVVTVLATMTACGSSEKKASEEIPGESPARTKDAVIYEVNMRQYSASGLFTDFEKHLDELWDMGINTLWFMPIFPISETNRS